MNYQRIPTAFFLGAVLLVLTSGFACAGDLSPYQSQIEAGPDENFDYAAVQLWMPLVPDKARGILCLILHPLGRGGSALAFPRPWIELAQTENCALMSISFAQSDDLTRDWCEADQGTGKALFKSLENLARQTHVPKLSHLPIVVAGVCAAGQFAFHLTAFAPSRIGSFVTIGGGKHDLSKYRLAASIPALLVLTPDRGSEAMQNLQSLYAEGRTLSAPWQLDTEPIAQYDAGLCSSRMISYLRQQLANCGQPKMAGEWNDSQPAPQPTTWLPLSICGTKLPPQLVLEPSSRDLGKISSSAGLQTVPFTLRTASNATVDSVSAFSLDQRVQTTIDRQGPGQWKATCQVDPAALPLGSSRLLVKVRFASQNKQLLGGTNASLSLFVSGPVTWQPLSLNFGSIKAGMTSTVTVEIKDQDGRPVRLSSISSPYPWIKLIPKIESKKVIVTCVAQPPADLKKSEFAGYFDLKFQSPLSKSLKIFGYGSIIKGIK